MAQPVKPSEDPLRNMDSCNSQGLAEYWNEVPHGRRDSDETPEDDAPPEEGEEDLEWLKQTGYESLLSVPEPGSGAPSSEAAEQWKALDNLSLRQAEVVKRRVSSVRDTLRKRRNREKARRPDMRHLFPESSGSGGDTRSRSATPDSLDSLSPPLTPPDSRLESSSPHSQGYHSCSRGSLDQLEQGGDNDKERSFRYELRIPLEADPTETLSQPQDVQLRRALDLTDRAHKTLGLFESSKNYNLKRLSATDDSPGVQVMSFHPLGSLSRPPELPSSYLGELRIPRVRSGSRSESSPAKDGEKAANTDPTLVGPAAVEGNLGRTLIDYLLESDAKRIQKLALIELTAMFDDNGISLGRRKTRRKRLRPRASSAELVFGASLTSLLERDQQRASGSGLVPLVLERVLTHLQRRGLGEEGLLRVPGHQHKVEQLRRQVDEHFYSQPGAVEAALQRSSAADVAALVKLFLRELPRPLLTYECMDWFRQTDSLPADSQPTALNLLCLRLPATNRAVLSRLLDFLAAVAERERLNKMSLENVAMIMAPNLMWPAQRRQKDISVEIEFAAATSRVVRALVRHRARLWDVSGDFVRQLRRQLETEAQERVRKEPSRPVREMKKLLPMRKPKDAAAVRRPENPEELQEGVMRVTAPQLSASCWPVTLETGNAAGHLVAWCCQMIQEESKARPGSSPRLEEPAIGGSTSCLSSDPHTTLQKHYLFEYGGNIGRRRLEHDAALLDCFHENPAARWVIECCHPTDNPSYVEIVAD